MSESGINVGLFVTCLVDLFRPSVGFAAVKLLEDAGCRVTVPLVQTCCGQPAYNSGDRSTAKAIAAQVVDAFRSFDYVVVPSGSCAGTIKRHYSELVAEDAELLKVAEGMAERTYELTSFLTDVMGVTQLEVSHDGIATYHDGCSGLRELGIKRQPRQLLAQVQGLTLRESENAEECCGFGGTFSIKYGDVSAEIVRRKVAGLTATEAPLVLAGDLGCLMNIVGRMRRDGIPVEGRHVAEVLAGMTDRPAIGDPSGGGTD